MADTVTANAVFEIDGWTVASPAGCDLAPEVAANETALRKELVKHFEGTFIVTGEPEIVDITVDGDIYDSWLSAYEYDQEHEGDEDA